MKTNLIAGDLGRPAEIVEHVFTGTEYEEVYYDKAFDYEMNRDVPPHVVVRESDAEFIVFPPYTY